MAISRLWIATPELITSSGTRSAEALTVTDVSMAATSGSSKRTSLVCPARTCTVPLGRVSPDSILTSSWTSPGRASIGGNRPFWSLDEHSPVPAIQTWRDCAGVPSLRTTSPRTTPVPTVSWALATAQKTRVTCSGTARQRAWGEAWCSSPIEPLQADNGDPMNLAIAPGCQPQVPSDLEHFLGSPVRRRTGSGNWASGVT